MYGPKSDYGIEWVKVEFGSFQFGNTFTGVNHREPLQHELSLPTFWISKTPITNKQFQLFLDSLAEPSTRNQNRAYPLGKGNHPVVMVSLAEAFDYSKWLSDQLNRSITLPSEAEWEKAASWNPIKKTKSIYPWGNEFDAKMCNCKMSGIASTTHVNMYPMAVSAYGVLDMVGNVWEWTRSVFRDLPYDPHDGREVTSAENNPPIVLRGGSFQQNKQYLDSSFRLNSRKYPFRKYVDIGFRVVATSIEVDHKLSTDQLVQLRKTMVDHLSVGELKDICFDMGYDHEIFVHETKTDLVRELVTFCHRRLQIDELRHQCSKQNPAVDWFV